MRCGILQSNLLLIIAASPLIHCLKVGLRPAHTLAYKTTRFLRVGSKLDLLRTLLKRSYI